MIKEAKSEWIRKVVYQLESKVIFPLRFKKVSYNHISIPKDHAILLLQNHISWWDGFWGNYLTYDLFKRRYHVMTLEDQIVKNPLLRHLGGFSVRKNSRQALESIQYAKELLDDPKNTVLIFPQGRLQSMHVNEIHIEQGVMKLIEKIDAPCQVIYNAVTIDYLESFKPTVTFHLLDLGTPGAIDTKSLQQTITSHHILAMKSAIRK